MLPLVQKKHCTRSVRLLPHFAAHNRTSHINQRLRILARLAKSTRALLNDSLGAYFRASTNTVHLRLFL